MSQRNVCIFSASFQEGAQKTNLRSSIDTVVSDKMSAQPAFHLSSQMFLVCSHSRPCFTLSVVCEHRNLIDFIIFPCSKPHENPASFPFQVHNELLSLLISHTRDKYKRLPVASSSNSAVTLPTPCVTVGSSESWPQDAPWRL